VFLFFFENCSLDDFINSSREKTQKHIEIFVQ